MNDSKLDTVDVSPEMSKLFEFTNQVGYSALLETSGVLEEALDQPGDTREEFIRVLFDGKNGVGLVVVFLALMASRLALKVANRPAPQELVQ